MARILGKALVGWTVPVLPGPPAIAGQTVRLERLDSHSHAQALHAGFAGNDDLWDYMPYGPFAGAADYGLWVDRMAAMDDPFFYAICDGISGQAMGVASYLRATPEAGSIEVGHICLSPLLQRGIAATEAMLLMMQWAFAAGYRRYEWKCNALNTPSRQAAQRLGFSFEGVFRNHMIVKGRNRDSAWFSVIDSEWPALQHAHAVWLDPQNFDAAGQQRQRLSDLTRPLLATRDPSLAGI